MPKEKSNKKKEYRTSRQQRILQIIVALISVMIILSMALSAINL